MLLSRRSASKLVALSPLAYRLIAQDRRMYLALNSVLIDNRVHWPDFARLAAQGGFPGTDVMLDAAMRAGAAPTNDLLDQLHLLPAAINFPVEFRKDDATFQAGLAKL